MFFTEGGKESMYATDHITIISKTNILDYEIKPIFTLTNHNNNNINRFYMWNVYCFKWIVQYHTLSQPNPRFKTHLCSYERVIK